MLHIICNFRPIIPFNMSHIFNFKIFVRLNGRFFYFYLLFRSYFFRWVILYDSYNMHKNFEVEKTCWFLSKNRKKNSANTNKTVTNLGSFFLWIILCKMMFFKVTTSLVNKVVKKWPIEWHFKSQNLK